MLSTAMTKTMLDASDAAYEVGGTIPLPSGFHQVLDPLIDAQTGFKAVLFGSDDVDVEGKHEVIVAFAGTEDLVDGAADLALGKPQWDAVVNDGVKS